MYIETDKIDVCNRLTILTANSSLQPTSETSFLKTRLASASLEATKRHTEAKLASRRKSVPTRMALATLVSCRTRQNHNNW